MKSRFSAVRGSWAVKKLGAATVLSVAPAAGLFLTSSPAHAAAGLFEDLLQSCTSQIDSMPIHARMPLARTNAIVNPRNAGGPSPTTCQEMSWVKFRGQISAATIAWAGMTPSNPWNCSHTTLSWGMYKKQGSGWAWVGGGSSFGYMAQEGGTCVYNKTLFPGAGDWGTFALPTGSSADQEYRVAFYAWSHDDPGLGHPDSCADPTNCSWPVKLVVGNSSPTPKQDFAIFRPSTGYWWVYDTATGGSSTMKWGVGTDVIAHGDYDGDYDTDIARARVVSNRMTWYVLPSSGAISYSKEWGVGTDVSVSGGDYEGDGRSDIVVYRPSEGNWYVVNSSDGSWWLKQWGIAEDRPIVGNFDDDLKSDFTVFRPSSRIWYTMTSHASIWKETQWGIPGDIPAQADFDGDFKTDVAVFRPSNGTFYWVKSSNGAGAERQWGQANDIPVPGYYDTDSKADVAVFRPADGRWYYVLSTTGGQYWSQWGVSGDVPATPFRRGL